METLTQSPVDNQLAIIEKSLPVFQEAGSILQKNKQRTTGALAVGNKLLNEWQAAKSIENEDERIKALIALDEKSNTYLVKVGDALKLQKEARAAVTQIMDEMKKMFTSLENDIDKSKPNTVPAQVQEHRNKLAKTIAEIERKKHEAAEKLAAKQREAVEITSKISVALNQHFQNRLLADKQKMTDAFNKQTLLTIVAFQTQLKGYQPEYKREHYDGFTFSVISLHQSNEEFQSLLSTVKTDSKYAEFNATYKAEMGALAQDLLDKLPSKKSELVEADERAKAAAEAAEAARIAEEKRQRQLATAHAANRQRLEEEARIAREAEAVRLAEVQRQEAAAAEERRQREAAEAARLQQEAEDARIKAEQEAEIQKQSATTMILFDQEASLVSDIPTADTRQGYEITVTHQIGYGEIFQYWFQNEGKNLPIDKIGNTKCDQMKAYVQNISHKQGRPCIESKFLKFEQSFKAVAKKQK